MLSRADLRRRFTLQAGTLTLAIETLADGHIAQVIEASSNWRELSQFGPPYWRPRSPAELKRKIAATAGPQVGTAYNFVLAGLERRLMGECSLHTIDWRNRIAQVGVCIWRPCDRRQGYGTAAVEFAIEWGFGHLGLERLEAWVVDGNDASMALFRRFGFVHEATLQGRYLNAGVRHAMHVLAISTSP